MQKDIKKEKINQQNLLNNKKAKKTMVKIQVNLLKTLFLIILIATVDRVYGIGHEGIDMLERHVQEVCVGRRDCLLKTYFYASVLCFYCCFSSRQTEEKTVESPLPRRLAVSPQKLGESKDR